MRKCKRAEETIKRNKLLEACVTGDGDIFKEIKKLRKTEPVVATKMDEETENIPKHFKNVFKKVYNKVEDKEELNKVEVVLE